MFSASACSRKRTECRNSPVACRNNAILLYKEEIEEEKKTIVHENSLDR